MTDLWVIIIFIILLLIPFSFAIIEYYKKSDNTPLDIRQDYSKDPAYFGKSFINILEKLLRKVPNEGLVEAMISNKDKEKLLFLTETVQGKDYGNTVVIINSYAKIQDGEKFISQKEVVSFGGLVIKVPTKVRALFVKGGLRIEKPLEIRRWLHVEGDCYVLAESSLGINCYCMGMLHVKSVCSFRRIFAKKIVIGTDEEGRKLQKLKSNPIHIKGILRSKNTLSLKVNDREMLIEGDIISDGDIYIEGKVWIRGNIVSNNYITLLNGCVVGEQGKVKSIVGKKGVFISDNVVIYGYVHTDGNGVIKATA